MKIYTRIAKVIISSFVFVVSMVAQQYQVPNQPVIVQSGVDRNETAVAVDPTNANHLMATWNDFANGAGKPGYAFSTDGGISWTSGTLTPNQTYQLMLRS